jgi:hypothetical protein
MNMADSVRSSLKRALGQLLGERTRLERQISAVTAALGEVGARVARRQSHAVRRRRMSASQKRAVSKRMKAYWAKRRAAKKA